MPAPSEIDPDLLDPIPANPFPTLVRWFEEARACDSIPNPEAMAVASVDAAGDPQVRLVLCRGFDPKEGRFEFFTNYESDKGVQLDAHPRASCVIHWDPLGRQVRFTGAVVRTTEERSDTYFASRDPLSQISAWASRQSRVVKDRETLEASRAALRARLGDGSAVPIPRPPHWGGLVIEAEHIELWSAREGRLHDRARWSRRREGTTTRWDGARLQP